MIDSFSAYLGKYGTLSESAKSRIDAISNSVQLPKNEIVLRQGERCRSIFLITSGSARMYYYHEGNEVTNQFFFDHEVIADMQSCYAKKRSFFNIQLLEASNLIEIKYSELEHLYGHYHEIEKIGRLIAIECFLEESDRNRSFQMYTARQRYEQLLKKYPDILNRVNLGHIASYIGVTQIQLSRIRSQQVSF
ncbi:Crp/Fnr family transcriptional regulator [Fulvivirgaceae bacterium BMA12]|uniref:Crp/Fnr family transcriptional regulator n=1 Tax=Agaribacillus aureus TaxID=3051825 RepID=A0ABT8LBR8_9BACT|nr:Crp/Fnr family transcriptional regulator [Fulvivirgaceae bacterium BMA12]